MMKTRSIPSLSSEPSLHLEENNNVSLLGYRERLKKAQGADGEGPDDAGVAYLRFYIDSKTPALMRMEHILEAAVLPSRLIATMPNTPAHFLGLVNHRGKAMWAIDFSQIVGLDKMAFIPQNCDALIVKLGKFLSAFLIYRIEGLVRIDPNTIQSTPSYISPALAPYMDGCVLQEQSMDLILNASSMVNAPVLKAL